MAKSATVYVCSACAHESAKWHGRCPACGEWSTLVEEARRPPAPPAGRRGLGGGTGGGGVAVKPIALRQVQAPQVPRFSTGIGELDRVLGGGLVPGSLVLLGGSPGIGKSTITTATLGNLAAAGRRVLYVSGEESAAQVRLRAERLGAGALEVPIIAETDLDSVRGHDRGRAAGRVRGRLGPGDARRRSSPARPARSARCARWRAG